jgi:subtilisin family serine protease
MRTLHRLAFLLALSSLAARASAEALLVAQLAGAPGASATARLGPRAAARDAAAIARAAPRLSALGLSVRRALLDALPPPAAQAPAAAVTGLALERVVLLVAADSGAADAAAARLVAEGLADWVEPLQVRSIADADYATLPATDPLAIPLRRATSAPARAAVLDSMPDESLFRDTSQWGLWNAGVVGGAIYGGVPRADVHALEAWRTSVGSDALLLAVADTGIDPAQPDLGGTLSDGSPRIVGALNVTGEPVPAVLDSFGHGTPVAGVMAARTNDGPHFSGRGVAGTCGGDGVTTSGCRILPIKISPGHSGEASSFDIATAIIYATDSGARAMNLSFAGTNPSRLERLALTYAITHGCVCVIAAGNNGNHAEPRQPMYPSEYAVDGLCIQVGASDESDQRASFSSYGPGLDLVAPGREIWSTWMTYPSYYGATYDGYVAAAGTSFAAPFVAGAVGLLATVRPELTDTDFQHVLRESAHDVGAPGWDEQTAWGRLDIGAALAAVAPDIGIWHDEVAAQRIEPDTAAAMLAIGEKGPGTLDRFTGTLYARRFAAIATVTAPDSFVDSIRVWPRVGGTMAARGDYRLPYFTPTAQVIALDHHTFTLRGWLYAVDEDSCAGCTDSWIPLPPEYARFGFTVMGRVARGARPAAAAASAALAPLVAGPSPFRGSLALRAPAAGRVRVLDASGRVVRSFAVEGGPARWDGRDETGREASPGLYFLHWQDARTSRSARVVKLGP